MTTTSLEARDERMRGMIGRLKVDVLELAYANVGATYGAAREACLTCAHVAECQVWLMSSAQARPTFCPNLAHFEPFARRQRA